MEVDTGVLSACRGCGQPDTEFEVVSEHRTAQGVVRYVRCTCGALQVLSRSRLDSSERVLVGAQSVPTVGAGASGA